MDDFHDVVYLIFEGASFILSRAHILTVEKGLRRYSMTEQSIPSRLIAEKDLTEVLEFMEASDFGNLLKKSRKKAIIFIFTFYRGHRT